MRETMRAFVATIAVLVAYEGLAWNPPVDTAGPVTVRIGEVGVVRDLEKAIPVEVTISNSAEDSISGTVAVSLTDNWRVDGARSRPFSVNPRSSVTLSYPLVAGKGTYSALYPIHARAAFEHAGERLQAHAVLIVQTEVPSEPLPVNRTTEITSSGRVSLWRLPNHQVVWKYFGGEERRLPLGWVGNESTSRCTFTRSASVRRGDREMPALAVHPPWTGGAGTIFAEYSLKLPSIEPIRFIFHTAIRDNAPNEPPSDGVTFRVWVRDDKLFERHSDSKVWEHGDVDLSKFAGSEVLLRLETHPGPKNDTTCDSAYWGSPTLVVGPVPEPETREEVEAQMTAAAQDVIREAREMLKGKREDASQLHLFRLHGDSDSLVAAIQLGRYGLLDAIFAFLSEDRELVMYGLHLAISDADLLDPLSAGTVTRVASVARNESLEVVHHLQGQGKSFSLKADVRAERGALKITVNCPEPITDFAPASFNQKAARVYAGMGNVIVKPAAFTLRGDGHHLSTSHVGVDFENGISLLEAVSVPPDEFRVDPDRKEYALHTHLNGTLTLVPSTKGAFDAAMKYREIVGLAASAGVPKLAGRFVFDVWGGRGYRNTADAMRRAIRYGMTDAVLIYHNWQRWGYDYRLPDIFPPNPSGGTLADFQELAGVCRDAGILFAPHDNYIDFYPDADGYTYEAIAFTEDNRPVKAWYNRGRDAQSYRFRPDRIQPFLVRNMQLIKENVRPTAYFIDVFSSLMPFDYYDWRGGFHPKTQTQKLWGETFNFVRDYLGDNAPQISESGHDALIGCLDGATCNHLRVDAQSKEWTVWRIDCEKAERTPWYDAVHRHRFILHGAGYSGRYQAGLDSRNHGIDSDDYLSTEVLDGHPGMVSTPFSRAAVRKYWLLHDFMRAIALKRIVNVEFADGDIHRQIISYEGGETVFVNRGESDWEIPGHVLPQYGFLARSNDVEAAVEKKDGVIADCCATQSSFYVNARKVDHQGQPASQRPDDPRFNPSRKSVHFGHVRTNGAFRLAASDNDILVMPLPGEGSFDVEIVIGKVLGHVPAQIEEVASLEEGGEITGKVDFSYAGGVLSFKGDGSAFAYRAAW
jgi:hypothetical protein